jgi:hypothetical protein
MPVLVRKYVKNGDKSNITKDTLSEGLELLNKTESDISLRVSWCNMEDIFFEGTNDYIRVIN